MTNYNPKNPKALNAYEKFSKYKIPANRFTEDTCTDFSMNLRNTLENVTSDKEAFDVGVECYRKIHSFTENNKTQKELLKEVLMLTKIQGHVAIWYQSQLEDYRDKITFTDYYGYWARNKSLDDFLDVSKLEFPYKEFSNISKFSNSCIWKIIDHKIISESPSYFESKTLIIPSFLTNPKRSNALLEKMREKGVTQYPNLWYLLYDSLLEKEKKELDIKSANYISALREYHDYNENLDKNIKHEQSYSHSVHEIDLSPSSEREDIVEYWLNQGYTYDPEQDIFIEDDSQEEMDFEYATEQYESSHWECLDIDDMYEISELRNKDAFEFRDSDYWNTLKIYLKEDDCYEDDIETVIEYTIEQNCIGAYEWVFEGLEDSAEILEYMTSILVYMEKQGVLFNTKINSPESNQAIIEGFLEKYNTETDGYKKEIFQLFYHNDPEIDINDIDNIESLQYFEKVLLSTMQKVIRETIDEIKESWFISEDEYYDIKFLQGEKQFPQFHDSNSDISHLNTKKSILEAVTMLNESWAQSPDLILNWFLHTHFTKESFNELVTKYPDEISNINSNVFAKYLSIEGIYARYGKDIYADTYDKDIYLKAFKGYSDSQASELLSFFLENWYNKHFNSSPYIFELAKRIESPQTMYNALKLSFLNSDDNFKPFYDIGNVLNSEKVRESIYSLCSLDADISPELKLLILWKLTSIQRTWLSYSEQLKNDPLYIKYMTHSFSLIQDISVDFEDYEVPQVAFLLEELVHIAKADVLTQEIIDSIHPLLDNILSGSYWMSLDSKRESEDLLIIVELFRACERTKNLSFDLKKYIDKYHDEDPYFYAVLLNTEPRLWCVSEKFLACFLSMDRDDVDLKDVKILIPLLSSHGFNFTWMPESLKLKLFQSLSYYDIRNLLEITNDSEQRNLREYLNHQALKHFGVSIKEITENNEERLKSKIHFSDEYFNSFFIPAKSWDLPDNNVLARNINAFPESMSYNQAHVILKSGDTYLLKHLSKNAWKFLDEDMNNNFSLYIQIYVICQQDWFRKDLELFDKKLPQHFYSCMNMYFKDLWVTFSPNNFPLIFIDGIQWENWEYNLEKPLRFLHSIWYDFSEFISLTPSSNKVRDNILSLPFPLKLIAAKSLVEKYKFWTLQPLVSSLTSLDEVLEFYKLLASKKSSDQTLECLIPSSNPKLLEWFLKSLIKNKETIVDRVAIKLLSPEFNKDLNSLLILASDASDVRKNTIISYLKNSSPKLSQDFLVKNIKRILDNRHKIFEDRTWDDNLDIFFQNLTNISENDAFKKLNTFNHDMFRKYELDIKKFNNYSKIENINSIKSTLNDTYLNLEKSLTQQYKNLFSSTGHLAESLKVTPLGVHGKDIKDIYTLWVKELLSSIKNIDKAIGISINENWLNLEAVNKLKSIPGELSQEFDHGFESISKAFLFKEEFEARLNSTEKVMFEKTKKHMRACIEDIYKNTKIDKKEIDELNKNLFFVDTKVLDDNVRDLVNKEFTHLKREIFLKRSEIEDSDIKEAVKNITLYGLDKKVISSLCWTLKTASQNDKKYISQIVKHYKAALGLNNLLSNCRNDSLNNFQVILNKVEKIPEINEKYNNELKDIRESLKNWNNNLDSFIKTALKFGENNKVSGDASINSLYDYAKGIEEILLKYRKVKTEIVSHLKDDFWNIDLQKIKEISSNSREYTIKLWDRENVIENLNMWHATHCCIAPDGQYWSALPEYLENENYNVIQVMNEDKIVGLAFTYIGRAKWNNHLVIDNVEINNSYSMDSEIIAAWLKEYARDYRDYIWWLEKAIHIWDSYNDIYVSWGYVDVAEMIWNSEEMYLDSDDTQRFFTS